jgi:hypothetical protein
LQRFGLRLQADARGQHQGGKRGQGTEVAEAGGRQGASHDRYPSFGSCTKQLFQHTKPNAVNIREL